MTQSLPTVPVPKFLQSARAVLRERQLPLRDRLRMIGQGARLWLAGENAQDPDALVVARSVATVAALPLEQRSAFARAFVVHAPAMFWLETLPARDIPAKLHMVPTRAYLKMAEQLPGSDRAAFLNETLPMSPTLARTLADEKTGPAAVTELQRAFRTVSLSDGAHIMGNITQNLNPAAATAVNTMTDAEFRRMARPMNYVAA